MSQIVVTLDSKEHKDFKIACINNDVTMNDKLIELIRKYTKDS